MTLRILVTRHAAFYSPLIATVAGGFLKKEGIDATYGSLEPGQQAYVLLRERAVDIVQSAVSVNWRLLEKGEKRLPVHFAQINRQDGFFLAARRPDNAFDWKKLEGATLLADHGAQPFAMLRYAAHRHGLDWSRIRVVDAGTPEQMTEAFLGGAGDYVHLQGPYGQQLQHDGAGHVVAAVGESMPPCAFSSVCTSREFFGTEPFQVFVRAFREAKEWVRKAPPAEIAAREAAYFPGVAVKALAETIAAYQRIGTWEGGIVIPRDQYEQSVTIFEWAGLNQRHPYDDVCTDILPGHAGAR